MKYKQQRLLLQISYFPTLEICLFTIVSSLPTNAARRWRHVFYTIKIATKGQATTY